MSATLPVRRSGRHAQAGAPPALPVRRPSGTAAGLVLFLPSCGTVVVPLRRTHNGWEGAVIADPTGTHQPGEATPLNDRDVQTALPIDLPDPTGGLDGDEFADIWLTRVWGRTRGGHRYLAASALARQIRQPGTRTVVIDQVARRRLVVATRLHLPGVDRILDHLTVHGILTRIENANGAEGAATYQLALPTGSTEPSPKENHR